MEPLVFFGACLVIWCGYLAALDAVRDLRAALHAGRSRQKAVKKRIKSLAAGVGSGISGGVSANRPLLQRL